MMMSGATKKPRRRPATYGKASRRAMQDYQSAVMDTTSDDRTDASYEYGRKITGRIRRDSITQSLPLTCGSQQYTDGVDKIHGNPTDRSSEGPTSPGSITMKDAGSLYNNMIYEVPLSDGESATSIETQIDDSRKRRKVEAVGANDTADTVWDDTSLQQHIAAEMGEATPRFINLLRQQSSPKIKLQLTSKPYIDTTRKSKKLPRAKAQSFLSCNATKVTKLPTRGLAKLKLQNTAQQRMPLQQSQDGAPSTVSQQLWVNRNLDSASLEELNPAEPITPPPDMLEHEMKISEPGYPSQSPFKLGIYKAQGIRAHVLTDGVQVPSPSQLDLKSWHIKDRGSKLDSSVNKNSHRGHQLQSTQYPRTKLKDRLHQSLNLSRRANALEEDGEGDSDSHSSAPSSKQEAETHGLRQTGHPRLDRGSQETLHQHLSQPVPRLQKGGPRITYSSQRSYLKNDDFNEAALLSMPPTDVEMPQRVLGRAENRPRPPKLESMRSTSEEIDEAMGTYSGAIQSIHELRQAGGNARVIGDIEAVLDDIDPVNSVPIALERSGLLDIATKLLQPEFCRRFLDHGLENRLITHISLHADIIANTLLVAAILQIMESSKSPHMLAQVMGQRVAVFLGQHLDNSDDFTVLVRNRKLNMSKALQKDVSSFCASFLVSTAWRNGRPNSVTTRVVSLQCLEYLVRFLRESGSVADILPPKVIQSLVSILALSCESTGLDQSLLLETRLALSILESCTITQPVSSDRLECPWNVQDIAEMGKFLAKVQGPSREIFEELPTLALRLCLNLTNNNPAFCEAVSSRDVVYASLSMIQSSFQILSVDIKGMSQAIVLDNLVLSLGLLINLAEWSESTRELFIVRVEAQQPPLDILSQLFQTNLARTSEATSEQETLLNVPFGYLSVLLCFLSISTSVRKRISSRLKGNNLEQLLSAVEEFLHYHRQIAEEVRQSEDNVDLRANFVNRLQTVVDRLKWEEGIEA